MKKRFISRKTRTRILRRRIARERIEILFSFMKKQPAYAKRYKELIKKIAKKYRIKLVSKDF